jgi:beta-N-acetylhexosaminidase
VASQFGWNAYQTLIDAMNSRNQRYTLLSLGNPYEMIYLQDVRSALAVYGKQEPNTTAGINVLVGKKEAGGILPVKME